MSWGTFAKPTALAAVFSLLILSSLTFAQTSNATLGGTVSDASGALIPAATVTASNLGTGIVNTTITNETGTYQFPSLQTGSYRINAELPGFRTQAFNVTLGGSQQIRLNFTLEVGDVTTAVDVAVDADTALATTSASIGSVFPDFQVRELPSASRNVFDMFRGLAGTGPQEGALDGNFAGNRISATKKRSALPPTWNNSEKICSWPRAGYKLRTRGATT